MAITGISLGSNLDDRRSNLEAGIQKLELSGQVILRKSSIHETDPEGFHSEFPFFNQCLLVETNLSALSLLNLLLEIEQEIGRIRVPGVMSDRKLDLDLLFYDELVIQSEQLILPHPRLHERTFVLGPLYEIYPEWKHPLLQITIGEMIHKRQTNLPKQGD